MNKLPLPIYSLIGKQLDFRDDWFSFLVTCKRIKRGLLEYPSRPTIDIFINNYSLSWKHNMSWKGEYTEGWTCVRGSCINFTEKTKCKFLYMDDDGNTYPYEFNNEDRKPFFNRCRDEVTVYRSENPGETAKEFQKHIANPYICCVFENINNDYKDKETYISFPNKETMVKIIEELNYVQKIADENGKTLEWF